jgi:hypothetical protein
MGIFSGRRSRRGAYEPQVLVDADVFLQMLIVMYGFERDELAAMLSVQPDTLQRWLGGDLTALPVDVRARAQAIRYVMDAMIECYGNQETALRTFRTASHGENGLTLRTIIGFGYYDILYSVGSKIQRRKGIYQYPDFTCPNPTPPRYWI